MNIERRTATVYGYVKPSNKKWLMQQGKKNGSLSELLDSILEKAKRRDNDSNKKKPAKRTKRA